MAERSSLWSTPITTSDNDDLLARALQGFSIEIGTDDAGALAAAAGRLPAGTDVFINAMPGERLDDKISVCRQIHTPGAANHGECGHDPAHSAAHIGTGSGPLPRYG